MNLHLTLDSLINYIGFTTGILLGIGIILTAKQKKSAFFLGLFIVCYAIGIAPNFLHDFNLNHPFLSKFTFALNVNWLLFPLFYLYVQYTSILKAKDLILPIGIALIGIFLEWITLFFFMENEVPIFYFFLTYFEVAFSIWVGVKIIRWIKKQKIEVLSQYSNAANKELNWSRNFVVIGLSFTLISLFIIFFDNDFDSVLAFINIVLLIWVALKGVFQKEIDALPEKINKKEQNSNREELKSILKKTSNAILANESYKKTDLTIVDVAKVINIHPKKLSESINTVLQSNFNQYINSFRINEAKKLLLSQESNHLSIEGIGNEVGFQSKSTFFRAFKREMGMTPNAYKSSENGE